MFWSIGAWLCIGIGDSISRFSVNVTGYVGISCLQDKISFEYKRVLKNENIKREKKKKNYTEWKWRSEWDITGMWPSALQLTC